MKRILVQRRSNPRPLGLLVPISALVFASCGGGGGGGGGGSQVTGLSKTLQDLGVSMQDSGRQGIDGMDLGDSYSPFGDTWELAKRSELLIMGAEVASSGERFTVLDLTNDETLNPTEDVLFSLSGNDESWILGPSNSNGAGVRAVVAADIDADGLEEVVAVYLNGGEVRLHVIQDETEGFAESDVQLTFQTDVTALTMQAARLNGDRRDDLVIGLTRSQEDAEVIFVSSTAVGFEEIGDRLTYAPTVPSPTMSLKLSVGNVDMDSRDEVAIVVNERFAGNGVCRFELVDDANAGFATLRALAAPSGSDQNGLPRTGTMATPLLVDIDGDDRCELIIATLVGLTSSNCGSTRLFLMAFEDAFDGGAPLGNTYITHFFSACSGVMNPRVHTLHVNALDVDGDGFDEFHVNQFVFDDFANSAPWTMDPGYQLDDDVIWAQNQFGRFQDSTSSMVAGEFTGDDREDIAIYRQDETTVQVWGRAAPDTEMVLKRSVAVANANSQNSIDPVILPVNIDQDGPVLSYSDGEYEYVFSEPIVLAVLAAAPCKEGIGQNLAECFTAFGNTTSTSQETERAVSVKASATVGVSLDGGVSQTGFELTASAFAEATKITNSSYREQRTVLYRTGVGEDTVIFTTIPIDRYTYTVVSHPDPAAIGEKVVVNLPRDPITLQAERVAYNNAVQAGSLLITSDVLTHTVGQPTSYPTRSEKSGLIAAFGGLQFGPQAVGLGSGVTSLTLQVGEAWSEGGALEKGFTVDLETTNGGVLAGTSFGASETNTVVVTSGSETTYQASVGAIAAGNHSTESYSFGLFTYVRRDPNTGQDFDVIQYWVE